MGNHVHHPLSRLWYRSHFPNVLYRRYLSKLHNRRMVTGESSPFYLSNHHSPGRIKTTLADAKLVVILRNPVDRAYSDYHMSVRQHRQSMTFEDANAMATRHRLIMQICTKAVILHIWPII